MFRLNNHIFGKVYDLTQENMTAMIVCIDELRAENARLRAALLAIANKGKASPGDKKDDMARAALASKLSNSERTGNEDGKAE